MTRGVERRRGHREIKERGEFKEERRGERVRAMEERGKMRDRMNEWPPLKKIRQSTPRA